MNDNYYVYAFRIFPTRDGSNFNYYAQPLQKHEIKVSFNWFLSYVPIHFQIV